MLQNRTFRKPAVICFCTLFFLTVMMRCSGYASSKETGNYFNSLQESLAKDGFDRTVIESLYNSPAVNIETRSIVRFFQHREVKLNYDQFTNRASIRSAKKYMEKYKKELTYVEDSFGVDRTVITAIILVETRLGKLIGNVSTFNTLSTLASLKDSDARHILWQEISNPRRIKRQTFDSWADRKSKWAYNELKAFITYIIRENIDPTGIIGSYAGAMGIAQFMPSNIIVYAKDGNQDGRIDLFNHADAIASIASYLKHFGWRPDINKKKAYDVIFRYNHSKYYVKTILKISKQLKG